MKGLLKPKLVFTFTVVIMIAAVIAVPLLSGSITHSQAASATTHSPFSVHRSAFEQRFLPSGSNLVASPQQVSTTNVPQASGQGQGTDPSPLAARISTVAPPVARQGAIALTPPTRSSSPNTVSHASFSGQGQTSWAPSDSTAAGGPNNVVETVNEQWAIYGRTGGQQYVTTFNNWFGQSGSLFDPKIVYDPWGGRFIMLVDQGSHLLLSVARQSNASGNWCNYSFPTVSGFADYPQLGVDYNGIYFGANIYNSSYYNELFKANRTQMESCTSTSYTTWQNLKDSTGNYASTIVPAVGHSYASSEYLVNSIAGGGCSITLWTLSGSSLTNKGVGTQCYSPPPAAAQRGSSGTIETAASQDNRLYQANYLKGMVDVALTGAYNWGSGNNSVIWWFKINTNATLYQQGGFGSSGYWYYFPAFEQDSNGNAVIVYDLSSSSIYPSIWYIGLTSNGSLEGTSTLVQGKSYYGTNGYARWGDYQSAQLDPSNSTQIWICGQYAAATNTWGTWIGNVGA